MWWYLLACLYEIGAAGIIRVSVGFNWLNFELFKTFKDHNESNLRPKSGTADMKEDQSPRIHFFLIEDKVK